MALFAQLIFEGIVQINDKTRLDARKSFNTGGSAAITSVKIEPEAGEGLKDVSTNRYLDWVYQTAGTKTITVEVSNGVDTETRTFSIQIITVDDDKLFSSDADLQVHENGIMSYVKDGRYSFLDFHRRAQSIILAELDEKRIWKQDGSRFEKADIVDLQEFKEWSTFKTLELIFADLSDKNGDKFEAKSKGYASDATQAMSRAAIRLDYNQNGEQEAGEVEDQFSIPAVRR